MDSLDKNPGISKKIIFMFPGQGSQYRSMGSEFLDVNSDYKDYFEISSKIMGTDILKIINDTGDSNLLDNTCFSQISIYTLSCALNDYILSSLSISREYIDTVIGHSLGEYSALYSSSAYGFEHGAELVGYRGIIMSEINKDGKGMMAAVLGTEVCLIEEVVRGFKGRVFIANYNDYRQVVISGYEDAVKEVIEILKLKGSKKIIPLKVGIASHCPLMKDISDNIGSFIDNNISFKDMDLPFFSTTEVAYINKENIKDTLTGQLTNPIKWVGSIEYMLKKGINIFVEVGPGTILSGLVSRIARENCKEITVLNTDKLEDIENLKNTFKKEGIINEA